jgi:hypothetical protein
MFVGLSFLNLYDEPSDRIRTFNRDYFLPAPPVIAPEKARNYDYTLRLA